MIKGRWTTTLAALSCSFALAACATGDGPASEPRPLAVGATFRDCPDCPQMVVAPAGRFIMGSAESEPVRDRDEGPQREVTIPRPFAIGKFEVTRGQYAKFVEETGRPATLNCSVWTGAKTERVADKSWRDPNMPQTDDDPVVCVSWLDAKAYVGWLAARTGQPYRLASEAEGEYAARAGAATRYAFGDDADQLCAHGNVADDSARAAGGAANWVYARCNDGVAITTAPVGSYAANRFGLHDMHGNVWEWVEDCFNPSYEGAPVDGSAWVTPGCPTRVDRGGGFFNNRGTNRAAERAAYPEAGTSANIGLRVALSLD